MRAETVVSARLRNSSPSASVATGQRPLARGASGHWLHRIPALQKQERKTRNYLIINILMLEYVRMRIRKSPVRPPFPLLSLIVVIIYCLHHIVSRRFDTFLHAFKQTKLIAFSFFLFFWSNWCCGGRRRWFADR